jgi:preprotein translocase subunit SecG
MQILNIFHVLIAIALIAFVLIQRGQGATAGAAFGSGASSTVFGARGAGNFLSRSTWVLAGLFCAISLTMAVMVSRMMASDEPDLGVLGATAPAAIEESVPAGPSVGSDEPTAIDLPSTDPAPASQPAMDEAASDLPAETEVVEPEAGSDIPPIEGDDPNSGSGES